MKARRVIYLLGAAAAATAALVLPGTAGAANNLVCGGTIDTSVTLAADMDCSGANATALTITASGVTLNLGGHTITGNNSYDVIDVDNGLSNVTVENGTISGGSTQVYGYQESAMTVTDLTLTGASYIGVYVDYGAGDLISNNAVSDAGYANIYGDYGANNAFFSNTLTDPGDRYGSGTGLGMYLEYEQNDYIEGNDSTITGNADETNTNFEDYYSDMNLWYGNLATGGYEGFYVTGDGEGTVTVTDNGARGQANGWGFDIEDMYADGVSGPTAMTLVNGNTATGGIGTATDPTDLAGFYDDYNLGETFTGNMSNRNAGSGYDIEEPWRENITNNTAQYNAWDGFYLDTYGDEGAPSAFSGNNAWYNQSWGFEAEYATAGTGNTGMKNGSASNNGGDCLAVTGCS